jgi:hypothetical protein
MLRPHLVPFVVPKYMKWFPKTPEMVPRGAETKKAREGLNRALSVDIAGFFGLNLVEPDGIEPTTSTLPVLRSPN